MNFNFLKKSWLFVMVLIAVTLIYGCTASKSPKSTTNSSDAASKVYVAPGKYDELYAFFSGGFSGQISVYGIPSGRLLRVIPVFSVDPEKSYGFSEESKPLFMTSYGFIPWDDAHHPQLSKTKGMYDGRWIFINANNTPRIARISLTDFSTKEIIEIPNVAGNHASPYLTQNTEYLVSGTRFSIPEPDNKDDAIANYKKDFKGTLNFIKVDSSGKMSIAFQILVPGFDYDVARCGKAVSDGWCFFTTYNTEQANTLKEINASQKDKDFTAAVNWKQAEKCLIENKATTIPAVYYHNYVDEKAQTAKSEVMNSVKVLTPASCPGLMYYLPTPKSPHGVDVDPTGEYIVASGKLSTVIPVFSFAKIKKAIEDKAIIETIEGIPVLKYESVIAGEVQKPCLGPLHTEFDGNGFAYTSCFVSSEIVKWTLGEKWEVVDRIPVYYSIGHLLIPGGDTIKPYGKYVIALNKITKDRYLPTGPELSQAAQLIDISGNKMKLLLDFPTIGEPHYAQAIAADILMKKSQKIYKLEENNNAYVTKDEKSAKVVRAGNVVHIYMTMIRSHFMPDNIEGVKVGDTVYVHVTNLEQDWDVPHGFAVKGAENSELLVMPGETKTLVWKPKKIGVYPFYCTDFCSALHQEMQGYIRVSAAGANTPLTFNTSK